MGQERGLHLHLLSDPSEGLLLGLGHGASLRRKILLLPISGCWHRASSSCFLVTMATGAPGNNALVWEWPAARESGRRRPANEASGRYSAAIVCGLKLMPSAFATPAPYAGSAL